MSDFRPNVVGLNVSEVRQTLNERNLNDYLARELPSDVLQTPVQIKQFAHGYSRFALVLYSSCSTPLEATE